MKTVYLAGPINRVTFEEAAGWRTKAAKALTRRGFLVINPLRFELVEGLNVVQWDLDAIRRSDILVAHVPDNVQAMGTAMEIFFAHSLDKPVFAWGAKAPSPWVSHHCVCVVEDLETALDLIDA